MDLVQLVINKSRDIGAAESARYFEVTETAVYKWWKGENLPSIIHAQRILNEMDTTEEQLSSWAGKKVLIGHPAYASVEPAMQNTLMAAMRHYGVDKTGYVQAEGTLIHEARNHLCRMLMRHETAEAIIMVDRDMVLPCGNADLFNGSRFNANLPAPFAGMNFISRLMSHDPKFGIIGATYVGRNPHGKLQCSSGFESTATDLSIRANPSQGLRQVGWVATGCILIRKWVLAKISEAAPTKFPEIMHPQHGAGWFSASAVTGEDVAFGRRAAQVGISSYLDCSLICGHIGEHIFWPNNTNPK